MLFRFHQYFLNNASMFLSSELEKKSIFLTNDFISLSYVSMLMIFPESFIVVKFSKKLWKDSLSINTINDYKYPIIEIHFRHWIERLHIEFAFEWMKVGARKWSCTSALADQQDQQEVKPKENLWKLVNIQIRHLERIQKMCQLSESFQSSIVVGLEMDSLQADYRKGRQWRRLFERSVYCRGMIFCAQESTLPINIII